LNKITQGASPKNSPLQGASQKKKITGEKTKFAHITGEYQPIYPKINCWYISIT
jgi:hypothetical protein